MHKYCNQCLYSTKHPFGLSVYESGCSGCSTHQEKNEINWQKRYQELQEIVQTVKNKTKGYDCVVPVTGDAEDYFVLSKVLELGLSPLVVAVNDYFKNDIGWHNLHQLITNFDVDSVIFNPDIRVYKDLVRTSLRKFDHILLPFLSLHTSFPVHIAYERKIPLIIWGQHQAIEQSGKFSHYDKVEMSKWSRKEHDLFETDIDTLIGNGAQVNTRDLNYYQYPDIAKLSRRGIKGLYLSNYFRWDPLVQNKKMLVHGFRPERNQSSFDVYERAGNSVYYQFHDLLKYKRVGYRKIRDHLVREIRHGRITRDEASAIESQYNQSQVNIRGFFNWLDVSQSGYEWFKLHRLNDVKNLICETDVEKKNIILPEKLTFLVEQAYCSINEFIYFGKGI
ncbi:N-acetyl sugar amidotransferase [Colwellia psychrerythraea]|uniref:N-acetyl sugar amidotransferase n=1 Tax=Colwellia psychrerythraea TaxID=28229 RepID=A0A099L217_COLPS|nr:N-acetyl sugar amidotransferase [Colwellia psychrerythraea]KGJ97004.1 N-acetyl sugar amidotransferase [Colwellia psychrerythraea]